MAGRRRGSGRVQSECLHPHLQGLRRDFTETVEFFLRSCNVFGKAMTFGAFSMESRSSFLILISVICVTLSFSAYASVPAEVHDEHLLRVHHNDVDAHNSKDSNFQCVRRISLKGDDISGKSKRNAEVRNVYDDLETTLEYGMEESKTRQPPADGDGSEGSIYDSPPSETAEVLGPDHKETGITVTDKFDAEINQSENDTVALDETRALDEDFETKFLPIQEFKTVDTTNEISQTDNYNNNRTGSEFSVQLDDPIQSNSNETKNEGMYSPISLTHAVYDKSFYNTNDKNQESSGTKDNLTTEETFTDVIVQGQSDSETKVVTVETHNKERVYKQDDVQVVGLTEFAPLNSEANVTFLPENLLVGRNDDLFENKSILNTFSKGALEKELGTTDTTSSTPFEDKQTSAYDVSKDKMTSHPPVIEGKTNKILANTENAIGSSSDILRSAEEISSVKEYFDLFDERRLNSSFKNLNGEIRPSAEKLYSSYIERYDTDKSLADTVEETRDLDVDKHIRTSITQALRDFEDKDEEDSVIIKSLLEDYPSFKKEKIEPGTLIEECSDCDIRILPIRPSQQRSTPEFEPESPPKARIKFSELPEGTEIQITKLGLSDGIFFFSYLSQFLSWIQPNEFPVGE